MKHKHYEMIVAKAANMDLVVLENDQHGKDEWYAIGEGKLPVNERYTYFLCLPQHKEAVLHWLNGGKSEYTSILGSNCSSSTSKDWTPTAWYMDSKVTSKAKPKKEKRWIAYCKENGNVYGTYLSEDGLKVHHPELTAHEIEVEV